MLEFEDRSKALGKNGYYIYSDGNLVAYIEDQKLCTDDDLCYNFSLHELEQIVAFLKNLET